MMLLLGALLALGTAPTAQAAPGDGAVTAVAAGDSHSVALLDDGTVVTWGRNDFGQRGDGSFDWRYGGSNSISASPGRVLLADGSPLDRVTRIAGGYQCPLAIRDDGSVWSWGYWGCRPGDPGAVTTDSNTASQVLRADGSPLLGAIGVAGGVHHGIAVLDDGSVWSWGASNLGTGQPASGRARQVRTSATSVLAGAVQVASKSSTPLVRLASGEVFQWSGSGYAVPAMLSAGVPISDATQIGIGAGHAFVKRADGTLWAWGTGVSGQLGNGASSSQTYPVQVLTASGRFGVPLMDVAEVAGTGDYSLARTSTGALYAWGSINGSSYAAPYAAPTGDPVDGLATGSYHALLRVGSRVYARGSNWAGQLADPSGADSPTWLPVNALPGETRNGVASDAASGEPARAGIVRAGAARTLLLQLSIADVDAGQLVTPWVELVPSGTTPSSSCGQASPSTHAGAALTSSGSRQDVTVAVQGLADETRYTWRSCLLDAVGGAGRWSSSGTLLVDESGPSVTTAAASTDHAALSATFTLGGTDAGAGLDPVAYSFDDGATWQSNGTLVRRNLAWNEPVSVIGRIRDAAGNVSAQVPLETGASDTAPPSITTSAATVDYADRSATFTLGATDAIAGLHPAAYSFDDGATWQSSPTLVHRNLAWNDTIRVIGRVRDAAGNVSAQVPLEATAVDTTAPIVEPVRTPRGWVRGGGELRVTLSDETSGVASGTASFLGTRVRMTRGVIPLRSLPEGRGTLRVVVVDEAGNRATWSRELMVDRTAPTIAAAPRAAFGRYQSLAIRDNVSGVRVSRAKLQLRRLGPNIVRVRVSDRAGNVTTRRMRIVRHLSLSRPHLNADLIVRSGSRPFIADRQAIQGSFRFIGAVAPWYAHTEHSPALVGEAQKRLQRFGFLPRGTARSGFLDIATIRAIQRYQADKGLPRLGTIGPRTRAALDADLLAGRTARSR